VIPTLILFGLAFGRWWRFALIAAVVGWPSLLLATGSAGLEWALIGGAILAALNTLVGVLAHQAILLVFRRIHTRSPQAGR
jgi:hypothetical protein